MKKVPINKLKPTLFSHLINFDFFFFDSFSKSNSTDYLNFLVTQRTKNLFLLNALNQFKSFKQFFRLLQFLKKRTNKNFLQILTPSEDNCDILNLILGHKHSLKIISSFSQQKFVYKRSKLLLLLDFPPTNTKYLYNCISRNSFYLIQEINCNVQINSLGSYKIFSNFENYKRLVFIGIVVKRLLDIKSK